MSEWFHAEGNRQQGPVPAGQLVELFRGNQISLDTLVWRDGMAQWQPLRDVVDELGLIIPALEAPPLPSAPAAPPALPEPADTPAAAPPATAAVPAAVPAMPAPAASVPAAKRGLSGCAVAALVGGGVLLALLLIAGLIAAIALPAYNDYTVRAKVAAAVSALAPLKGQVQEFAEQNQRCPGGNDAGFPAAGDFTRSGLSAVNIGRFQNGHCGIEATLAVPGKNIDGDLLWLEYDRDSGRWQCSGESPDKLLPGDCRR